MCQKHHFLLTFVALAVLGFSLFGYGRETGHPEAAPDKAPAVKAFALRMQGKAGEAETFLKAAVTRDKANPHACFELARTYFYMANLDEAQRAVEKAVQQAPDQSRFHHLAGIIAAYQGVMKYKKPETRPEVPVQLRKALTALEKAVALDPKNHQARLELINLYLKNPPDAGGSRDKAEDQVKKLAALDRVYGAQGRCMLLGGKALKKQRALWKGILSELPENSRAHEEMGRVCLRLRDEKSAVTHLERALSLTPDRSIILVDLTRHYVMNRQYKKAEAAIQRFLSHDPAPSVPLRSYGCFCAARVKQLLKQGERARSMLDKAKELDPHCWMFFMQPPAILFDAP